MDLSKMSIKKIRELIVFTALLVVALWKFDVVIGVLKTIWDIIFPFVLGGAIAFLTNVPMSFLEKKIFEKVKKKNKIVRKLERPISLILTIVLVVGVIALVMQPMLASIYCGLISGIGLGLCFRVNASTGGMDIPALLIHKFTHISSGNSVMIIDALTVLLGMSTYGVEPALIGVLSVFTSGFAIDKTILIGSSTAINCMVISDQWVEIKNHVLDNMKRGVTVLEGKGGYTNESKPVLMIVIPQKMYSNLEHEIMKVDPRAFIIVNSVHEVDGEGFTYELEDLK